MATFQTYSPFVGIKEEISDVISNISPRKTPFQSSIGNVKVSQPIFQWQEDSLRSVSASTAIEGADSSEIALNNTTMRSNYTAIFTEAVKRGLLTMAYAASFRIQPALTIDESTAKNGVEILREVFDVVERERIWQS